MTMFMRAPLSENFAARELPDGEPHADATVRLVERILRVDRPGTPVTSNPVLAGQRQRRREGETAGARRYPGAPRSDRRVRGEFRASRMPRRARSEEHTSE